MERFSSKAIGKLIISTQFFGPHFGHAAIREEACDEALRLNAEEVHDLHYALGRILAEIDEAKRNG